jgi:hypothetical protein
VPTPSACPGVEGLKQFRLGLLAEVHARQVEQHLSGCPACLERLPVLAPDDALVQGLRAQRNRPRLNNPLLARAQQEARAQPFRPAAAEHATPASQSVDATVAAAVGSPGAPEALQAFLSPARGPGELGWLGPFRVLRILGEGGMGLVLQGRTRACSAASPLKS